MAVIYRAQRRFVPCGLGPRCPDHRNEGHTILHSGNTYFGTILDIDECGSDPCLNNGICVDDIADYSCECILEYTGIHCESGYIRIK